MATTLRGGPHVETRIAQVVFLSVLSIIALVVIYVILKRPEPASPPLVITLQPRPTAEPLPRRRRRSTSTSAAQSRSRMCMRCP